MISKDQLEICYWSISALILSVTAFYVYYAPIKAVKIGRQLNDEQHKDIAKRDLFLTLFAHRGNAVHPDYVNGLNKVEVVFEDCEGVLTAWRNLYEALNQSGLVNQAQTWDLLRTELLSQMSMHLGYNRLKQTEIMKHYIPQGHVDQAVADSEFRTVLLDYLKSGNELQKKAIEKMGE